MKTMNTGNNSRHNGPVVYDALSLPHCTIGDPWLRHHYTIPQFWRFEVGSIDVGHK